MSVNADKTITLDPNESTNYIWIFRKGNGQAVVYPSPAILKAGSPFQIVNKTDKTANVTFTGVPIAPQDVSVPSGESRPAAATKEASGYFEYEVYFDSKESYAEGGSKPGVIIEH